MSKVCATEVMAKVTETEFMLEIYKGALVELAGSPFMSPDANAELAAKALEKATGIDYKKYMYPEIS